MMGSDMMSNVKREWLWTSGLKNMGIWRYETAFMPMWRKCVLITHLPAMAWEILFQQLDFEKAATRVGMRMAIDESDDDHIKIQGVSSYSFSDAGYDTPED